MTTEELKQLADLSDKLKQLIPEMQLRVVSFENNRDLNRVIDPQYHYWDGKRSEASFITEKLLNIFEENENLNEAVKPALNKTDVSGSLLADRWDAEDFLIEKSISNHPIVFNCNNKESYEVADLMAEFANRYYGNEA